MGVRTVHLETLSLGGTEEAVGTGNPVEEVVGLFPVEIMIHILVARVLVGVVHLNLGSTIAIGKGVLDTIGASRTHLTLVEEQEEEDRSRNLEE